MLVSYNGYGNDHFTKRVHREYDNYFKYKKSKWPTNDRRVFYGIVNEPKIFVIGSAAQGIIKSIKKITPRENIFATEINLSGIATMLFHILFFLIQIMDIELRGCSEDILI
jgi:hypothetical protein